MTDHGPNDPARIRKRSVLIAGHHTSLSVENVFWDELIAIAQEKGLSANALVSELDAGRTGNLSSAVRIFVLRAVQDRSGRL